MIIAALATPAMVELAPTSLRRAAGATDPAALSSLLGQLLAEHDRSTCAEIIDRDTDESGRSPLHHACWRGALANVETLLDLGCDHGAWSTGLHSYGKTPLFYATTRCRNVVVQLLLARGAKTRILNNKGQSVLSLAASHLKPEVIEALVLAEQERLTLTLTLTLALALALALAPTPTPTPYPTPTPGPGSAAERAIARSDVVGLPYP